MAAIFRSRSSAAEFNTDLPVVELAGVTRPQITAMPCVSTAIDSVACRLRSTNHERSTRSRGGYPQTLSSGKRMRSAPALLARRAYRSEEHTSELQSLRHLV